MTYPICIEGVAKFFTSGFPESILMDTANFPVNTKFFISSWLDKDRGDGQEANYKNKSTGASFTLNTNVKDTETDLLKLQASMRILDDSTNNRRTITFATGAAFLPALLEGKVIQTVLRDVFSPTDRVEISMMVSNAHEFTNCTTISPHFGTSSQRNSKRGQVLGSEAGSGKKPTITFLKSPLWSISKFNEEVNRMADGVSSNMKANNTVIPPGGDGFVQGLTAWDFAGATFEHTTEAIPPLKTHYALMNAHEDSIDRKLPIALAAFNAQVLIQQTGMTMDQVMALPDKEFAPLFCQSMVMSRDACMVPYNRDFKPTLGFSLFEGMIITCKSTENMALPCSASAFLGREYHEVTPMPLQGTETMKELADITSAHSRTQQVNNPCIFDDDCESSAGAGKELLNSTCSGDVSPAGVQSAIQDWPVFKHWTDSCVNYMSAFLQRGVNLVKTDRLQICTAIGLATNASASVTDGTATSVPGTPVAPIEYNGHCFMVGKHTSSDGMPSCFLLEGTAPMRQHRVTKDSPRVSVIMVAPNVPNQTHVVNMPTFLTLLGKTVTALTQITNKTRGYSNPSEKCGWKTPTPIEGWLAAEMHMCGLDSDPTENLAFYNRIMFCGLKCTEAGLGCMPVQESTSPHRTITAGCHPYDLNSKTIRGVDLCMDDTKKHLMKDIMNEAMPPIVSTSTLQAIARQWVVHEPLTTVNRDVQSQYKSGVSYITTTAMETPATLRLLPVMLQAKSILIDRFNKINLAKPNSDGIFARVVPLGTGVHTILYVPNQTIANVTVVQSLKQALLEVQWPTS